MAEHDPAPPLVSIIIVVYRTPDFLRRALDSIEAAGVALPYEVLVIENAPVDARSKDVCRGRERVRYLPNERNLGFGKAVNQGIELARGKQFLILNPDVEVSKGAIEALSELLLLEEDVGLVAPRLHYPDGTLQHSARRFYTFPVFLLRRTFLGKFFPNARALREHLMLDWDHETTRDVDWVIGGAVLARREAVADVGKMDERFFLYFEDVDWCYRMHQRGWRVVYHPAARMVHHYQRMSAGLVPRRGHWIHLTSVLLFYEKWSFLLYWLKLRRTALRRILLAVSDLTAVVLAFLTAYFARRMAAGLLEKPLFAFSDYLRFLLFTVGTAGVFFVLSGLYRERMRASFLDNLLPVGRALVWTTVLMMASTFLFSVRFYSRIIVVLFFPLALLFVTLGRTLWLHLLESLRAHDLDLHRVGVLGPESARQELQRRVERYGRHGMELVSLHSAAGGDSIEKLVRRVRLERVQEVALFEDWEGDVPGLFSALRAEGTVVRILPRLRGVLPLEATLTDFYGWPAFRAAASSGASPQTIEQRAIAWAGAIALSILLGPFAVLFALSRRLLGRSATEEVRLHVGGGESIRLRRLAGARPGRGLARGLMDAYPTLPHLASGRWAWVGICPLTEEEWQSLNPMERGTSSRERPGILGPWTLRPMSLTEKLEWNESYGRPPSVAEDLRILGRIVLGKR